MKKQKTIKAWAIMSKDKKWLDYFRDRLPIFKLRKQAKRKLKNFPLSLWRIVKVEIKILK